MNDPEDKDRKGSRKDGRNLVQEWQNRYSNSGIFVWNKEQFDKLDAKTPHVLGLFERSHMRYEADRLKDNGGEPSLAEMTVKSIDILSQNPNGFFLMVEGGRIDHAHHDANAYRSLEDMVAFDNAIKAALGKVNLDETLVIVTADHSHTLTISGYPKRGNPILETIVEPDGKPKLGKDGKPFTTLGYANGPGAVKEGEPRPVPDQYHRAGLQAAIPRSARQRDPWRRGCRDLRRRPLGPPLRRRRGAELHLSRDRSRDEAERALRPTRGRSVEDGGRVVSDGTARPTPFRMRRTTFHALEHELSLADPFQSHSRTPHLCLPSRMFLDR